MAYSSADLRVTKLKTNTIDLREKLPPKALPPTKTKVKANMFDLREKLPPKALPPTKTKVKANMFDLREKLPPKALPPTKTKPFPKKLLQPPPPPPPFSRNACAPSGNRVPSHYAPVRPTTAAHGQPSILPPTQTRPMLAEAKKITVTVPGLTSEVRWTFRISCLTRC